MVILLFLLNVDRLVNIFTLTLLMFINSYHHTLDIVDIQNNQHHVVRCFSDAVKDKEIFMVNDILLQLIQAQPTTSTLICVCRESGDLGQMGLWELLCILCLLLRLYMLYAHCFWPLQKWNGSSSREAISKYIWNLIAQCDCFHIAFSISYIGIAWWITLSPHSKRVPRSTWGQTDEL